MEKRCGGGDPNPSTPPFDGGGEQLSLVNVDVEHNASSLGLEFELDDKMPFLQMLQTLYTTNNMKNNSLKDVNCMPKLNSPVMSAAKSQSSDEKAEADNSVTTTHQPKRSLSCRKMRKPKRAKVVVDNKKDAEKQRMTHIAVERNRRRLMSDYLVALRSLLPHGYASKGDQASIVSGVIDYVKKLEHHVKCLEEQKRNKKMDEIAPTFASTSSYSSSDDTMEAEQNYVKKRILGKKANLSIMVVQTHASLRIECEDMKQSELIKFLAEVEALGLTILHLSINSIHNSSSYSLSLKMEDECKIRSAEEISSSVDRVLNSLNISNGLSTRISSITNQNHDDDEDESNVAE